MNDVATGAKPLFDVSTLFVDDENFAVIDILKPNGDPTGMQWEIRSADSPAALALAQQFKQKLFNRARQRSGGVVVTLNAKEVDSEEMDTLVSCVKGWNEFAGADGASLPFTHDNVREILTRAPGIKYQVAAAVKDLSLFTKG